MRETILKVLIVAIAASGFVYFLDEDVYRTLIREDGILENLTAAAMLLMTILLVYRLIKRKEKSSKWILYNVLLALACFFGFGEEISWGQRIFSIESSEFFSQHNLQNETNIHNLEFNGIKLNQIIFSIGLTIVGAIYFIGFYWLYRKVEWFKKQVDTFGVHIPKPGQSILLLLTTAVIMVIPDGKKWELWEVVFVLIFFLVLLDPYNARERIISSRS